uniref:FAD dependent oxidoreductase n=1 Tax=Cyanothece sp. (strain PCC 7425 / ATCC 29141) TaxID=395961 RepID=B8HX36_CYAP4
MKLIIAALSLFTGLGLAIAPTPGAARPTVDTEIKCEVLVVGGGLAGVATAYEALKAGRTVCLTEISDWLGGQVSAQGTSALDERPTQRAQLYFPSGYLQMRQGLIELAQGNPRPGDCWVSYVCFLPAQADQVLRSLLEEAERAGSGKLHLFLNTVVKELQTQPIGQGTQIVRVRAIQHQAAAGAPPLNTYPLSQTLLDAYSEEDSKLFQKKIIQLSPPPDRAWIVVEATETGELLALADLPYRLGIDPLSYTNPSASSQTPYPYCPQAFTYTFAIAATPDPQTPRMPPFYPQYAPFYSYVLPRYAQTPALVFTYRRIWSERPGQSFTSVTPGDISMQNWEAGNDYGPGTAADNLIYTRAQLKATGQLAPGGWQGGVRVSSLKAGEELAQGYYYWLVKGTTDARLGAGSKQLFPNLRYLQGLESPMGTVHGLSKYPYMRESRRLIARPAYGYPGGFSIDEIDFSRKDFQSPYYQATLSPTAYHNLTTALAGLKVVDVILGQINSNTLRWRTRSRIYSDSVGIGQYNIDFHPCMLHSPPEKAGNIERPGERQGADEAYPFQIPLRAMIPPRIDNLVVTGKNMAMSHIAAAAYRVHSIEWSAGAAAGTVAAFSLDKNLLPYRLVANLPSRNRHLESLQKRLQFNGNPTAFPGTSIFNENWQNWR